MYRQSVTAVIIGGPREGEAITVPYRAATTGVLLPETALVRAWGGDPRERIKTVPYRWERWVLAGTATVNLLVRSDVPTHLIHEHLGNLLSDAARSALVGEP